MANQEIQRKSTTDHILDVETACNWLGLTHGRTHQYIKLLKEFAQGHRKRENILCINESYEIVEIYQHWHNKINEFPGLYQKIKNAFLKGPILQEDEITTSSSNVARNDAFTYFLSGIFLSRKLNVTLVDGLPRINYEKSNDDICLDFNDVRLIIECKRPQSSNAVVKRTKEGIKKIKENKGIIALDCSAFIRPADKVFESDSEAVALKYIGDLLEKYYTQAIHKLIKNNILAIIFFARVPTMTRLWQSRLTDIRGNPLATNFRPGSICNINLCTTKSNEANPFVQKIHEVL